MTTIEHSFTQTQQPKAERDALFPTSVYSEPEEVDDDGFPSHIIPGSDEYDPIEAENAQIDELNDHHPLTPLEGTKIAVGNISSEVAYAGLLAETDDQREALAGGLARSVDTLAVDFEPTAKKDLAQTALEALKVGIPEDEALQRALQDVRTANQLAHQKSVELNDLQKMLQARRLALIEQLSDAGVTEDQSDQIRAELRFINDTFSHSKPAATSIAKAETSSSDSEAARVAAMPVPNTDELETQFAQTSQEADAASHDRSIRAIAKRAWDVLSGKDIQIEEPLPETKVLERVA